MARPARPAANAKSSASSSTNTPSTSRRASAAAGLGLALSAAGAGSASPSTRATAASTAAAATRPVRASARTRRSIGAAAATGTSSRSSSSAPSPSSSGPLTPADPNTPAPSPAAASTPKQTPSVEPKVHALRNALAARDRAVCPYPSEYGGNDHCGVAEEDAADDVLMAICGACATMDNVALSPDELASVAFEHGWLRPPSVAVAPSTMIANAIRVHLARCSKAVPARKPLLTKYQLSGSMAEAALEPALHPDALAGGTRPKGPVWYLSPDVGRAKWRNPFAGIVIPKNPVRRPSAPRKPVKKDKRKKSRESTPQEGAVVPRIKLRLSGVGAAVDAPRDDESDADMPSSSRASSRSRTVDSSSTPLPTTPCTPPGRRHHRPRTNVFDTSESETSDSDVDMVPSARRRQPRPIILPPAAAGAGARFPPATRPAATHSPLGELFFSPINTSAIAQAVPTMSPFPSHCLDNTTWVARRSAEDEIYAVEESSSDDEEMRDPNWGTASGFMIKADEDEVPPWAQEDDPKLAAATDAMRQLFPFPHDELTALQYNQLDNRPAPAMSETSSLAESSSTATACQGKIKSATCPAVLPAWALSSPVSSPSLAGRALPPFIETSPTQYLHRREYESRTMAMEIDVDMEAGDESWLDESGQLPVHAEDTFSDVDVGSTIDASTPERERQIQTALQTAEWAREAACATSSMHIKQEPEDYYPSPAATTEEDILSEPSRESTVSTASSPLTDLPDVDSDTNDYAQEFLAGPETVPMDELDDWLPNAKAERTPHRGRGRQHREARGSGSWGGIGVNNPFTPCTARLSPPPLLHKRGQRNSSRRRSAHRKEHRHTPSSDVVAVIDINVSPMPTTIDIEVDEDDAIGPADLEQARVEAEAREEQHRAQKRAEAEESRRRWDACRRAFANAAADSGSASPSEPSFPSTEQTTPWSETPWGSTESVPDLAAPMTLSPLALQMSPMNADAAAIIQSLDPKALHSPPGDVSMMDSVISIADIEAMAAALSPAVTAAPLPAAAPAPTPPRKKRSTGPIPIAPAPEKVTKPLIETNEKALAPKPVPKSASLPNTPTLAASKPPPPIAPAPPAAATQPAPQSAPSSQAASRPVPVTAPPAPQQQPAPLAPAPPRTVSPVARTTASPTEAPSSSSSASSTRPATPSGGTTKRLLPGIDACVVDNLPCYSHVWEIPSGGKCTVLRRLDTDFVNGTALLTALNVPSAKQGEYLNAPTPTLASHRTVPLISPQGLHHAPGVPGVWIPLVEARDLATKLGLAASTVLANILRADLFQLFRELAGISLRQNTSSSESFGMPFVTQPQPNRKAPARAPSTPAAAARPAGRPPLVRQPSTQPDGCPQPKRRRATVVAATQTREQVMQGVHPPPQSMAAAIVTPASAPPAPLQPPQPASQPQAQVQVQPQAKAQTPTLAQTPTQPVPAPVAPKPAAETPAKPRPVAIRKPGAPIAPAPTPPMTRAKAPLAPTPRRSARAAAK